MRLVLPGSGALWTAAILFALSSRQACGGESSSLGIAGTNDPMCSVTNVAGDIRFSLNQPASTRRMIERLARLREHPGPGAQYFRNDLQVIRLEQDLAKATTVPQRNAVRFELGKQLVQAGRPADGLAQFQKIEESLAQTGGHLSTNALAEFRIRKAIALLRIGELENCLNNHNSESCLFPVRPAAYHKLQRGSRGAIDPLLEQLRDYPNDLRARWLLNIAYMTLGEWPEKVPAPWVIPPSTFKSEYEIPFFPEVAGALGLDVDDLAGGCILDDFDNDGFIDLMVSSWSLSGQLRYFHNDGNGRFTERTAEAQLGGLVGGLNIQQTDYNNDGNLDVWIMRGAWQNTAGRIPNSLLRNNGDGTFTDVTEEVGLLSPHPTQTSVWFDFDGDGWLDLFIGNETWDAEDPDPCQLFHNNGNGKFTECAKESNITVQRLVKGVACADYDGDGRPDLYLSCRDKKSNLLFHNDGPVGTNSPGNFRWHFSEQSQQAGIKEALESFPTWFFDYDNDGHEDLFVCGYMMQGVGDVAASYLHLPHHAALPRLYHNNGDGTFTNVTAAAGLDRVCQTMGSNFGDLDNDGWLDFYLGTGDPEFTTLIPKRMFRNAEGKSFQEVTTAGGFGHLQKGHAVAFADLDNDGDQDVYMVVGGAFTGDNYRNALFLNPGNGNHWIKLKLQGTRSNRAAIGARIKVSVETPKGPRSIYKTVNSGGSFGSSPLRQEIGLGDATKLMAVEIFWPSSGIRQVLTGVNLDRCYRIREDDSRPVEVELPKLTFDLNPVHTHLHPSTTKL